METTDLDIDTKIENIVKQTEQKQIRIKDLVMKLDPEYNPQINQVPRTITRAIARLVKRKKILRVNNKKELESYGIKEKDGRATYLLLPSRKSTRDILNYDFELLQSKEQSPSDRKLALIDIEQNKTPLTSEQIDILSNKITLKNIDDDYRIIRILYFQVFYDRAKPNNKTEFIKNMNSVLNKYRTSKQGDGLQIRAEVLGILSKFNDKSIITEIKKYVEETEYIDLTTSEFSGHNMAEVIYENSKELFEFQRKLMKENQENKAKFIQSIRDRARNIIEEHDDGFWIPNIK